MSRKWPGGLRLWTIRLLGQLIRQLLKQQCRPASTAAAEAATAQRKFGSHKAEPADATAAAAKVDAAAAPDAAPRATKGLAAGAVTAAEVADFLQQILLTQQLRQFMEQL